MSVSEIVEKIRVWVKDIYMTCFTPGVCVVRVWTADPMKRRDVQSIVQLKWTFVGWVSYGCAQV